MTTAIWVAAFVALLFGLFKLHQRWDSLGRTVLVGLVAGLAFGWVLQAFAGTPKAALDWINIVGNGYVNLLKMIAMPLVFVSILAAVAKIERAAMIGKISFWVIAVLIGTTAIAALDGAVIANLFGLDAGSLVAGDAEVARGQSLLARQDNVANLTVPGLMQSFIPTNITATLAGMSDTAMISAVVIASLLGIAALQVRKKEPEHGVRIVAAIETLQHWVMALVRMVIRLTPYGVAALMTKVVVTTDANAIWQLAKFLIASYVALVIMLGVHALVILLTGRSPLDYFRKVWPVLIFAFTSRSSAATIPLNIEAQIDKLKVASPIANFSASFGATIGQNGCAGVYPAMLAIMIAPTIGIDPWSVSFIASVVAVSAIASFGVAGVGGGATFAAIIVLSTLGLPIELAGLLISIEPLIDMMRTAVNVSGSMTSGVVTNRVLGEKVTKSEAIAQMA